MSDYNAKGAGARSRIIQAQGVIAGAQEELPKLDTDLKSHRAKCMADRVSMEAQLKIVEKDAGTMDKVLEQSKCAAAAAAAASASLLECKDDDNGKSHIKF